MAVYTHNEYAVPQDTWQNHVCLRFTDMWHN